MVLPFDFCHSVLNDSKKLTPARRERIFGELQADSRVLIGIGSADVEEIDRLNILRASHLAMERAVRALPERPCALLVDGLPMVPFPFVHQAVVGGDALSLSIAAASVIAKVTRDHLMVELAEEFPGFGFEGHKGYASASHIEAVRRLRPSIQHRVTWLDRILGIDS